MRPQTRELWVVDSLALQTGPEDLPHRIEITCTRPPSSRLLLVVVEKAENLLP
jgi:hypothetical protein